MSVYVLSEYQKAADGRENSIMTERIKTVIAAYKQAQYAIKLAKTMRYSHWQHSCAKKQYLLPIWVVITA